MKKLFLFTISVLFATYTYAQSPVYDVFDQYDNELVVPGLKDSVKQQIIKQMSIFLPKFKYDSTSYDWTPTEINFSFDFDQFAGLDSTNFRIRLISVARTVIEAPTYYEECSSYTIVIDYDIMGTYSDDFYLDEYVLYLFVKFTLR